MNNTLKIQSVGMVSGLARGAEANCAAMRLGYDCFQQTDFRVPSSHEVINGAVADLGSVQGLSRLVEMLVLAVEDALTSCSLTQEKLGAIHPIICLPDTRKAYVDSDIIKHFHTALDDKLGTRFYQAVYYENSGALGFIQALLRARQLLQSEDIRSVLIAGVDNLLTVGSVSHYGGDMYGQNCRLLTENNADAFIPGEAAAAILLTRAEQHDTGLFCTGIGMGSEPAPYSSGKVTRADGLVQAMNQALNEAGCIMHATDYRISNLTGEHYFFEEDALALQRTLRPPKAEYPLWHPADSLGHVDAAAGAVMITNIFWAAHKAYAPGARCLGLLSSDNEQRGAFLLEYRESAYA